MALPKSVIPSKEIKLASGEKVLVRGLTRAETHRVGASQDDIPKAEAICLSCGCGVSEAEAIEWLQEASSADADQLLNSIMQLSGLGGQGK